MTKTIETTKLQEYVAQKQKARELAATVQQRVAKADEEYNAVKAEYTAAVKASLLSGKDDAAARNALADRVDAAERTARRLRAETAMMPNIMTVTPDDLVAEFRSEVGPAFKAAKVTPGLEAVRAAKRAYAEAVFAFKAVEAEAKALGESYSGELGASYQYKFAGITPATRQEYDYYFLRPGDAETLLTGQVPPSLRNEVGVNG